jgi:hypothetical protein
MKFVCCLDICRAINGALHAEKLHAGENSLLILSSHQCVCWPSAIACWLLSEISRDDQAADLTAL